MWKFLSPAAWAAAAYYITVTYIGPRGWYLIGPVLLLIFFARPDLAFLLFASVVGIIVLVLLLWGLIRILPWLFFFGLGIYMAYGLVIGFGMLIGAPG